VKATGFSIGEDIRKKMGAKRFLKRGFPGIVAVVRRRKVTIVLATCFLVGIGVVAFWPADKEPEFDGKKLSEWIEIYQRHESAGNRSQERVAGRAIQAIGSNALPHLLKWARYDEHPWQARMAYQLNRLGYKNNPWEKRIRRASGAWEAFQSLGPDGVRPIMPEVARIASESKSFERTLQSIFLLRDCGSDAIPALLRVIAVRGDNYRVFAIMAIPEIQGLGTNGPAVAAALLTCLKQPDDDGVTSAAAGSLGKLALEPNLVIPALAALAHDNRRDVRLSVIHALGNFGTNTRVVLPYLVAALQDSDGLVRSSATNALLTIAPEVLTNRLKEF